MKLMRLMRLQKAGSFNVLNFFQEMMSVSTEMRWFFMFFCYFAMTTHVVSCFWIIAADFD